MLDQGENDDEAYILIQPLKKDRGACHTFDDDDDEAYIFGLG